MGRRKGLVVRVAEPVRFPAIEADAATLFPSRLQCVTIAQRTISIASTSSTIGVRMMNKPAGSRLELAVERGSEIVVVLCSGKLVAGVNDRFYREVGELIPGSKRIVLDMTELTHMDRTGIGTLVRLYVSARSAGCALQLRNMGKSVRQLLGVTHLIDVLAVVGENNIRFG